MGLQLARHSRVVPAAVFGLRIGNTDVTFGALVASVMVFGLGYGAARLFQGWLDAQVLQPAGISGGVRNSIRTGVGYVGIMVAALAAFSYAGFNLSSLAIIAGALSLGIGFGLQNLVNNFVSGLILLAERPIKVGDLVVVGGEEGYVRKISVRSTNWKPSTAPVFSFRIRPSSRTRSRTGRSATIFVASPSRSASPMAAIRVRSRMFSWRLPVTIRRCLRRRACGHAR